mmetsp:Transcript_32733/g.76351  ORF Transcript_32733/g.76351 Transcript_32733/m.76351 type:complete len:207 (+) Transcript_32733:1389-2009(+)
MLLLAERFERLAALVSSQLLEAHDRVGGALLGLGAVEQPHHFVHLLHVEVRQLQQHVLVEPQRLREQLRELDDVHRGGDEALLHDDVEQPVEQPVRVLQHHLHVRLQRRRYLLAEEVRVQQRLHLHDVVVEVALVLDEMLLHPLVQLAQVVRLLALAGHALAELDGGREDARHELGRRVLLDLAVEAEGRRLHDAVLEKLGRVAPP